MLTLRATHSHFVRCIKPNLVLKPKPLVPSLVLTQLRCSGTFEAVQLMALSLIDI